MTTFKELIKRYQLASLLLLTLLLIVTILMLRPQGLFASKVRR